MVSLKKVDKTTLEILTALGVVLGIIVAGAFFVNSLKGGHLGIPQGKTVLGIESSR